MSATLAALPAATAFWRPLRVRSIVTSTVLACLVLAASLIGGAGEGAAAGSYDPSTDSYSMASITSQIGASAWWDAGYTGAGVDVAVIDTGVSPVQALSGDGKVVYGPDISTTSQIPSLKNLDAYGHGTFMAGLIAGHDPSLTAPYSQASASVYRGVAPDARIVSIKVGAVDGGVDVTQVIAAIDWVVQHAHDPGFNIRVINLSYGTNSSQAYTADPLAYAAEQAWKHGIVVIAAAGNTGYQRGHGAPGLADPAYDPYIIGVGGYDTGGTQAFQDDQMGSYSASACSGGCKQPDFVAPGSHVQGLRVPGSFIDTRNHGGLDSSYARGSGTSEATAITSGAVALILQRFPALAPDQVKQFIQSDAQKLRGAGSQAQGDGELDLTAMMAGAPQGYALPAAQAIRSTSSAKPDHASKPDHSPTHGPNGKGDEAPAPEEPVGQLAPPQQEKDSNGTGSVEGARGSDHLTMNGKQLIGEIDIFGQSFSSVSIADAEALGNSWSGGVWNGSTWSGSAWSGNSWSGSAWSGNTWSGNTWSGNTWSGNTWSGNTWSGNTWSGNTWSGNTWSGGSWS